MVNLLENWVLMAVMTPTLWAVSCLLNSYLIGSRIYLEPVDGVLVSCLFCLLPAVMAMASDADVLIRMTRNGDYSLAGMAAGLSYAVHLYFYFRTLHCLNDVSGAETFFLLSILIVPLLAWLMLDEVLPVRYYLALLLASLGVLIQCLPVIRTLGMKVMVYLVFSVLAVSLSLVLQTIALKANGFSLSTLCFNMTCLLCAVVLLGVCSRTRQRLFSIIRKVPFILALVETLDVMAVLSSHRAAQLGPSVSLVALLECLLPLLIILISVLLILLSRFFSILSSDQLALLKLQVAGARAKFLAFGLVIVSLASLSI